MSKELGKIKNINIGHGGYQDAMLGLYVELGSDSWSVVDFTGTWDAEKIKHDKSTKWTESERDATWAKLMRKISKLLKDGKVADINKLIGLPVECTFDGSTLTTWRLLTEVI